MATGYLSPIGLILQAFSDQGIVGAGYLINTYVAGSTTPVTTYTDSTLTVANTNPIVLRSNGRLPFSVWAPSGTVIKMVLTDASSNVIAGGTVDNIPCINDVSVVTNQRTALEIANGVVPTNYNYPAYDVRRYGAVGDGVTNDSPAFNTAGSMGVPAFVPDPPVSWLLNSNVTGAFESVSWPQMSGAGTINFRNLQMSDQDNIEYMLFNLEAGTAQKIECYGDSTMYGNTPGGGAQVGTPPPALLQNLVNTWIGNTSLTVVNNALGGTALSQMLAGTDGSGSTFASKMSTSTAQVVYCNHCVNDAYGHAGTTTAAVYRNNLITFIRLVRAAGKTPVLVTPHPIVNTSTYGAGFGSIPWANATGRFAQIMREVAAQHGVILVDTNKYLTMLFGCDNSVGGVNANAALTWLPDGAHGTQATYYLTGSNLAEALFSGQVDTLMSDGQVIPASRSMSNATGTPSLSVSTTSRYGVSFASGSNTTGQTLRILFKVGAVGLDLSLLHPIWSAGAGTIQIQLDGTVLSSIFSEGSAGFATNLLVDYDTQLVRNITPGFHQLILTTLATGYVAFHGLRARASAKPVMILANTTSANIGHRQLVLAKAELYTGSANAVALFESVPMSSFIDGISYEWTAQMAQNSFLGIGGYYGTNAAAGVAQLNIGFGLNASGYATIEEATDAGTYSSTVLDSTDHSAASHLFSFSITNPGGVGATASLYIDGSLIGTRTLTQAYQGGILGIARASASAQLIVTNVERIWNL